MHALRVGRPQRRELEALQQLQRLQQHRPLRPDAALDHRQPPVLSRDRLLDPRRVRGQVRVSQQPARGSGPFVDPPGDRSAIKVVGHSTQPLAPVRRRLLHVDQLANRLRQVATPRVRAVAKRHQHRLRRVCKGDRPVAIQRGQDRVQCRWHSRRFNSSRWNAAFGREMLASCQSRGDALPRQHLDRLPLTVIHQPRHLAAKTEIPRVDDRQHQQSGRRSVDRVAPILQDGNSGFGRLGARPAGHHDSLAPLSAPGIVRMNEVRDRQVAGPTHGRCDSSHQREDE